MENKIKAFERILGIIENLRANCPWDQQQTFESLRHLTIEEVYELGDAILEKDTEKIKKELGDIFLHIIFYAKIASEKEVFDIADVINAECDKLIHRHPHIYGDVKVKNAAQVSQNWEKLKLQEGNISVLGGVPSSLPSMIKAMRIQEKARSAGFDWEEKEQVWNKVMEELSEFKTEADRGNKKEMKNEFGDLIFSLINYARFIDVNPEEALEKTNLKFISRFRFIEEAALLKGKALSEMSLAEMDALWDEAKSKEM